MAILLTMTEPHAYDATITELHIYLAAVTEKHIYTGAMTEPHTYAGMVTEKYLYGINVIGEINGNQLEPYIWDGLPDNYEWLLDEMNELVLED